MNSRLEPQRSEAEQRQQLSHPHRLDEIDPQRLSMQTEAEEDVLPIGQIRREDVGLQRAWWREQINGPRGLRKATALALALTYTLMSLLSPAATLVSFVIGQIIAVLGGSAYFGPFNQSLWQMMLSALVYALPMIGAGAVLAYSAPRNAVRGAILASAIKLMIAVLNLAMFSLMYRVPSAPISTINWQVGLVRETMQSFLLIVATWLWVRRMRQDR